MQTLLEYSIDSEFAFLPVGPDDDFDANLIFHVAVGPAYEGEIIVPLKRVNINEVKEKFGLSESGRIGLYGGMVFWQGADYVDATIEYNIAISDWYSGGVVYSLHVWSFGSNNFSYDGRYIALWNDDWTVTGEQFSVTSSVRLLEEQRRHSHSR